MCKVPKIGAAIIYWARPSGGGAAIRCRMRHRSRSIGLARLGGRIRAVAFGIVIYASRSRSLHCELFP